MKLQPLLADGNPYGWAHWCPGCQEMHRLPEVPPPDGWAFNGDLDRPTFTPSFKHSWNEGQVALCCHYILTAGVLDFQGDSTHALRGPVPLPDIPDDVRWPRRRRPET
jgi:hypothetical protein